MATLFGTTSNVRHVCVYGGASKGPQIRDLERGLFCSFANDLACNVNLMTEFFWSAI